MLKAGRIHRRLKKLIFDTRFPEQEEDKGAQARKGKDGSILYSKLGKMMYPMLDGTGTIR